MPFRALAFRRPIADSRAYISNPFGNYYDLGFHTGIDVLFQEGSIAHCPIVAVAWGVVTFAQRVMLPGFTVWGNLVIIRHDLASGETIYSRTAHVENMLVQRGQPIYPGQHIGDVGNAFGVYPYHLHFDLSPTNVLADTPWDWPHDDLARVRRDYVDPVSFIRSHGMASDLAALKAAYANVQAAQTDLGTVIDGFEPPPGNPPPPVTTVTMFCTATDGLKVRDAPITGARIGGLVYREAAQVVDSGTAGWLKIPDYNGTAGYVSASWMSVDRP